MGWGCEREGMGWEVVKELRCKKGGEERRDEFLPAHF